MVIFLVANNETNKVLIPNDAIRFRIIANSNDFDDLAKKAEVKADLEPILFDILDSSISKDDTKSMIDNKMPLIKKTIDNHNVDYKINYGLNYFPEKTYKGVTYSEGKYESLVVTLGDGLGENWWCVLFPPLCMLEAKEENYDDYTYSYYIKDVLDKYF